MPDKAINFNLRPCPFCGGVARITRAKLGAMDGVCVRCDDCGGQTETVPAGLEYNATAMVVSWWNRRKK